ncbi:MAG TPA: NlpC/P60 family protein [Desulfosporosinus sp.]|nr:NlpC/P60 family protein [Desulfosporosinus sp.]
MVGPKSESDAIPTSIAPTITDMKPGDLVFFSKNIGSIAITHVGIYIGNNKFLEASSSKGLVTITSLSTQYYLDRLVGVKRIFIN